MCCAQEQIRIVLSALTLTLLLFAWPERTPASTEAFSLEEQEISVGGKRRAVMVPVGYVLEVLTESLREPRMITFTGSGDLFVGSRSGEIYRLPSPYTEPEMLVKLSGYPHSVAFREGEILIARTDGLYRAPYLSGERRILKNDVTLLASLPGGQGHNSRTVRIGPDGRVYLGLGISGNCSAQFLGPGFSFENRREGILVLRENGTSAGWETHASGLRNPVGFDWHPSTGVMYATNNGPDHLGFDQPPEYFSRLEAGSFHGMPWYQFDGVKLVRDECAESDPPRPLEEVIPPVATFPARSAPMGVTFAPEDFEDAKFAGDAVTALHGSWATAPRGSWLGNRATRRHPAIVLVRFVEGEARRVDNLVTGFQLPDGRRWARPIGTAFGPDGALYFTSDEGAEALFRLRRKDDRQWRGRE